MAKSNNHKYNCANDSQEKTIVCNLINFFKILFTEAAGKK